MNLASVASSGRNLVSLYTSALSFSCRHVQEVLRLMDVRQYFAPVVEQTDGQVEVQLDNLHPGSSDPGWRLSSWTSTCPSVCSTTGAKYCRTSISRSTSCTCRQLKLRALVYNDTRFRPELATLARFIGHND